MIRPREDVPHSAETHAGTNGHDHSDAAALRAAEAAAQIPIPVGLLERAELCVLDLFTTRGLPSLRYTAQGDWYEWIGTHWAQAIDARVRDRICRWLSEHRRETPDGWVFFLGNPEPAVVDRYLLTMRGILLTEAQDRDWLDGPAPFDTQDVIPCRNGLLHWPSNTIHRHTPAFFNLSSLPFDFDRNAECPQWRAAHLQWWPDDGQSADLLQEAFGYTIANRRDLQKFFLVRGPTRSGKGITARVLTALCGEANTTSTSPRALAGDFGTQSLINKTLAVITDARTAGVDDLAAMTEELLTITGNDRKAVRRKNREDWIGTLRCNVWSFSNENLKLPDSGSAITGRAVFIDMGISFLGREDIGLERRCLDELSGILNWSVMGLRRMIARGRGFIESSRSHETRILSARASNPVLEFIDEHCVLGKQEEERRSLVYDAWREWCRKNETKPGRGSHLIGLLTAQPGISAVDRNDANYYTGIRLRTVMDS